MTFNHKYKGLIIVVLLFICLLIYKVNSRIHTSVEPINNKITVSTYVVTQKKWQSSLHVIGNVKASQSIVISSEVPGIVEAINVESGKDVTAGQVLIKLQAGDIEAELQKAKSSLDDDTKNYERRKALLPMHYISVADVDHCKSMVDKDQSDVKREEALLAKRNIAASFSGAIGIWQVQVGQYINPGQALVNIESLDPVYVDFSIPEKWVSRIKTGLSVVIKSDAFLDETFTGLIVATSHAIDLNNRSLNVRAVLPNPSHRLLSGMAVSVSINEPDQHNMIIPQAALAYTPEGVGVYIVDQQSIARWRPVTVGERQGDEVIILSGVKLGEAVVIAGAPKIDEGTQVVVNNNLMVG